MRDVNTVVLVTSDTLRYDKFHRHETDVWCPFLCKLADRGIDFRNYYASGPGTSSAFPGILASAYPMDHGYRGLNDSHEPLAQRLSEQGVRTVGITASSHASSLFNYDRGFDVFYDNPSYRRDAPNRESLPTTDAVKSRLFDAVGAIPMVKTVGAKGFDLVDSLRDNDAASCPYERAETMTSQAIDILETEAHNHPDSKTFVWIHYMEPHAPYYPPYRIINQFDTADFSKEFVNNLWDRWNDARPPMWENEDNSNIFTDRERRALELFYRIQVKFLDEQVERLYERIKSLWGFDETAFIFTSDHGEEFFDHGDLGHRAKVYDELVHVPFFCYSNKIEPHVAEKPANHVDLAPTITELLGREPTSGWQGQSLLPLLQGEVDDWEREYVVSEICHRSGYGGEVDTDEAVLSIITDQWKYIRNNQIELEELYRHGSQEIPANNRVDDDPEIDKMRKLADERLSAVSDQEVERQEMSDDLRDQLHQLGYIDE